jgi:hypothetical protein
MSFYVLFNGAHSTHGTGSSQSLSVTPDCTVCYEVPQFCTKGALAKMKLSLSKPWKRIGIAPLILNFGNYMTGSDEHHAPAALPLGEKKRSSHSYLTSAFCRRQKNLLHLPEFGPRTVKLTASPTQAIRTPQS